MDRDVVPDEVADRTPEQLDVLAREEVASAVDLGFVAQLEREVVNVGVVGLQQIDRVVIAAAAQEGEEIAAPIRHFESEHVAKNFTVAATSGVCKATWPSLRGMTPV